MATDKYCKTCRHWHREEGAIHGLCNSTKFQYQGRTYLASTLDGLDYWDAERYYATFSTGPYFGCVHYVAQAGPDDDTQEKGRQLTLDEVVDEEI